MVKSDVLMVLFEPGLGRTTGLSNIHFVTLSVDAVYIRCLKPSVLSVLLTGQWKLETFLRQRPTVLMLYSANALLMWLKMGAT